MKTREAYSQKIRRQLSLFPICALLGPRQCGKTTLAKIISQKQQSHYFDLESPRDQLRLQNPELQLKKLNGLIILDEIQMCPELFPILRVLADRKEKPATFLILGSASPDLIKRASETLAGRVGFVDMHGFDLSEVQPEEFERLWIQGGFPLSFLAASPADSLEWRDQFIRTFLERDLPQFGVRIAAPTMLRFWTMLSHVHGQVLNSSSLARSMGITDKTIRSYLDDLTHTYMVRQLLPWFENLGKRQVKSPKIYIRDSGILHSLLNLSDYDTLHSHPSVGASWEGFAMEQILRTTGARESYFWSTHSGAELDLMLFDSNGRRIGYEFKFSENPSTTKSMRIAINDLQLHHLNIICPGDVRTELDEKITVVGLNAF